MKIDATAVDDAGDDPAGPDGSNRWFQLASCSFGLTTSDALSGVAQKLYTLDGGATQTYTGAVTVSGQGTHTISYWSVDDAENTEATGTATIKLDTVKPSTSIAVTREPNGWRLVMTTPSFT